MNRAIDELVKVFLKKDSLQDCSATDLQRLTNQFPFFTLPQLLLEKKIKDNIDSPGPLGKAALYFHSPLQLDLLLNNRGNAVIDAKPKEEKESVNKEDEVVVSEPVSRYEPVPVETEPVTATTAEVVHSTEVIEEEKEETSPQNQEQEIINEPLDEVIEIAPEPINESIPAEFFGETKETTPEEPDHESFQELDNPALAEEQEEVYAEPAQEPASFLYHVEAEEPYNDEEVIAQCADESERTTEPAMVIPSLKIEAIDPATAELSFQPYHTVDYFAALGIKNKDDGKPKDKFGQQLKSFTEWLKILKKSPAPAEATGSSSTSEKKVEEMAQHSLAEPEVVTEAMAEVWEKQGNKDKAIRIYNKLSLLNPSKSAYFAAKIDHLKHS